MRLVAAHTKPRLKVWAGFADGDECAALVALARPRLNRSTVLNRATGASDVMDSRTSQGAYLARDETPLVATITTRAAELLGVPRDHIEPLQIIRYGVGDQYLPHDDWFDPKDPGSASALAVAGQRTKTVLLYLNTPEEGGSTSFPNAGAVVSAIEGNAVQFEYPTASHADLCLHGGDPVQAGEKWALNVWARERAYGSPASVARHGVHEDWIFNAEDCAKLRAFYDEHVDREEGGTDHVVRVRPGELQGFVDRVTERVNARFPAPKVVETVVLARMPAGVAMENHADNVRWNGSSYEPNHTPERTHTAVTYLSNDGGAVHYGDNPHGASYSLEIPPREGHAHMHACGPDHHHRVAASAAPRYTFVCWFKKA